jgi:hypothetical protein
MKLIKLGAIDSTNERLSNKARKILPVVTADSQRKKNAVWSSEPSKKPN